MTIPQSHFDRMRKEREGCFAAQAEELKALPPELHRPVFDLAWEFGHSAGLSEVGYFVHEIAGAIAKPIDDYTHRIESEVGE